MDNLHKELYKQLEEESDNAKKYYKWYQEECSKTEQLKQQKQQDGDNLIKLARYVDDKDSEIATLKTRISELEEQNNPPFSADTDMACDIPMKA